MPAAKDTHEPYFARSPHHCRCQTPCPRIRRGTARRPPYEKDSAYVADNARNSLLIEGEIPVLVVQIADRYVRRVDCFVREGERVETGQKIGMIRMGSQCDLFLPKRSNATVLCRPRDKVLAGETVLARY